MPTTLETPAPARPGVLGIPDFRRLWSAQTVSALGDQIFPIAAAVAVLDAGGAATQVGLVLGARWLAIVLFALVGGVWADRLSRRAVMIAADVFRAVALAALALYPGTPSIAVLAGLVFLVGGGEAFFRPAEAALLPQLVPEERRASANALISVSLRTAAVIGPGVGGVLVVAAGPQAAFGLNAVTFLVSLAFLLRLREPAREPAARTTMLRELGEGWAEVRSRPWILGTLFAAALLLFLVVAPEAVLLPVIGRREFGTDLVYAWAIALMSLGGVIGAIIAMRWRPRRPGVVAWLGGLLFLPVLVALAFPVSPWPILAAYLLAGIGWEPFAVYWQTAVQREIPADRLGRVASLDWMASFSLMPLGMALTGPLVAAVGETAVLLGAGACLVVLCLGVLAVPGVPRMSSEPEVGAVR
jgi:DHA3 family tetracycline resistance protein-like MFS transporter